MEIITSSSFFWVASTIVAFSIGAKINAKYKNPIFSPILIGTAILIIMLVVLGVNSEEYNSHASILTFFLTPITCMLAIPIYRQIDVLCKNLLPILVGSFASSITAILSLTYLCRLFAIDEIIYNSLIAKSVTTPIALSITANLGGLTSIIMLAVTVAGLTGATMLPEILKFFKITDDIAVGVAIGAASHAVGTSRAVQINETVGAMSGLSIGVTGIMTSLLVSIMF